MTKNPFINAFAAALYIALVASVMFYGLRNIDKPDTVFAPIAMISLFTLSAAIMAYIFMYEPAQLLFNNNKKQALTLFVQTTALFALITIIIFTLLFLRVL